jgi:hypothetical protein
MWNHPIKRFASSTFVAGVLLATALASHAQAATPCKAACQKLFRDDVKMCVLENNCGNEFTMCRTQCVDQNMPGPDLSSCLAGCRSARVSCRQAVAQCRAGAVSDLTACKDNCSNP